MRPEHWLYTIPLRLQSLFRRKSIEEELDDEIRFHLDQQIAEYIANGLSPEEARLAAIRATKGLERYKEECRDMRRVSWIEDALYDIRYALRMLRKDPGFAVVAILTLALGIGANTAIFSVVNSVLLRPLPYPDADRIVAVRGVSPMIHVAEPIYRFAWDDWADHTRSFEDLATYQSGDINFAASNAQPERVAAAEVSQNFFEIFGIAPLAGRTILREEQVIGHPAVAVISARLCSRLGAPQDVVGKTFRLNGRPTVIVGVMPFGFEFPEKTSAWLPMAWSPNDRMLLELALNTWTIGHLKPGVSLAQAGEELTAIQIHSRGEIQKANPGTALASIRPVSVISLHDRLAGPSKPALLLLLGAVGFVLLIACADVANLLLARAVQRQREIALRAALGARRLRLIRQGFTECILLSCIGGGGGLLLAYWSLRAVRSFIPEDMLFVQKINLDTHVLFFLMAVSIVSGMLFGLFPVLHALRVDLNEPLKEGASNAPMRHSFLGRARGVLAVSEIAMALVLLSGAGLLIKSFWRLTSVDAGFHPENVLTSRITLPYSDPAFFEQTLQRISASPGIVVASYITNPPFSKTTEISVKIQLEEETPAHLAKKDENPFSLSEATPDYFCAMGIPLVAGRVFNNDDRAGAPPVTIINSTAARLFWPGQDPLGRRISLPVSPGRPVKWVTIVGIVGDTKHNELVEEISPEYYVPTLQFPDVDAYLVVRISGEPAAAIRAIRQSVAQVNNTIPLSEFVSMTDRISASVASQRFGALLLGTFAGLALTLAAAGIYGVMSYNVARRTREIGIRVALGATGEDVMTLILRQSLALALVGIGIGLAATWGLTQLLSNSLYGVNSHDPLTLTFVSVLLAGVAMIASYIPAHRATRVNPIVALRNE